VADTPAPAEPFDIDPPACFYLGREYDLKSKQVQAEKYVMVDAREFCTHGVIVGMTGSGKTGLAISLLEEVAIDGYPAIIIDPKGDLTNLLLQFPNLPPAEFAKWLNAEDAQAKGLTVEQYAQQLADRWKQGLEETGQTVDRIDRLKKAGNFRIYTPGSEMGLPLSILGSFAAPKGDLADEFLTKKIEATATALLGLTGISSDPMQSREHILVSQLLFRAWKEKKDLDLPQLIRQIEKPPFQTVGTYSLETFFPAKERVKFASSLNNVLAAPGFATWTSGESLDLAGMLFRAGKPQHLIFYVAHLDDTQRMFFITLLLEEVLSWTRRQSGTSNLRAMVYFDEVFGYLPPHPHNPPSKQPLLTLLKQGRAFGVGVVLATQNPVDLDYKALSNAGTWFIGKLTTERDKARLLEGLESVSREQGTLTDRGYLEKVIASLSNRIFLMHSIHRNEPTLFQSRWALSFLRGPMTREQVALLMKPYKKTTEEPVAVMAIPICAKCFKELPPDTADVCPHCAGYPWTRPLVRDADRAFRESLQKVAPVPATLPEQKDPPLVAIPITPATPATPGDTSAQQPVLPPDVTQFYLPINVSKPAGGTLEYRAWVLGFAEVVFVVDKRAGKEHREVIRLLAPPAAPGHPIQWGEATAISDKLAGKPDASGVWGPAPEAMDTGRKLKGLEKTFAEHLYSTRKLDLLENRTLGLISEVGESADAFRQRCRTEAENEARAALEMERAKFKPRFEALDMTLPDEMPKKSVSLWQWLTGSGGTSGSTVQMSDNPKERKLLADYEAKKAEIQKKWQRAGEEVVPLQVKPRKTDVRVTHFGLVWMPYWRSQRGGKTELTPAYSANG
jgi:hypothetical protein